MANIDDIAEGHYESGFGGLVSPESRKLATRVVDYCQDIMFAVGAGFALGCVYDKSIDSPEESVLFVGGVVAGIAGFSGRLANVAMRYTHNRGTYKSFRDFVKRV